MDGRRNSDADVPSSYDAVRAYVCVCGRVRFALAATLAHAARARQRGVRPSGQPLAQAVRPDQPPLGAPWHGQRPKK